MRRKGKKKFVFIKKTKKEKDNKGQSIKQNEKISVLGLTLHTYVTRKNNLSLQKALRHFYMTEFASGRPPGLQN